MIFYELCENVWGGSPATEQINGGIESIELVPNADVSNSQGNTPIERDSSFNVVGETSFGVNTSSISVPDADTPLGLETLSSGDTLLDDEEEDTEESNGGSSDSMKGTVKQRRES